MKFPLRRVAWAAFLAAVILLVVIGVTTYRATQRLVASEKSVSHTREVQLALEEVCSDSLRANNARRGFVLTGDDAMLRGYASAVQEIPTDLQHLRRLTADNASRLHEIDDLEATLNRHVSLLQGSIDSEKAGASDAQQQRDITLQSATLAEQVRSQVKAMQRDEGRLLEERGNEADITYRRTLIALSGALLLALGLLAAEFYSFNLEFTKRERTERVARQSEELLNAFFSSSTVGFGILDAELRYQRVNEVLAAMAGLKPQDLQSRSIQDVFGERGLRAESVFQELVHLGKPILDLEVSGEMRGKAGGIRHWLVNYFPIRDHPGQVSQIGVIALDVSERRSAENAIRRLSARLLNLQDQERRRIAREIHDSLGQYLVGLKITVEMLGNPAIPNKETLFSDCKEILDRCITETRTLSHLLHPPLLDEAGFSSAASWFVSGFSQRSGIPVTLDLPNDLPRLPDAVEIALFRVLQESLTNVHRHSRSKAGEIRLQLDAEQVTLEVKDNGSGMPPHVLRQIQSDAPQTGVGLAGMRERINELGGRFEVESNSRGTLIRVTIPLPAQPEAPVSEAAVASADDQPLA